MPEEMSQYLYSSYQKPAALNALPFLTLKQMPYSKFKQMTSGNINTSSTQSTKNVDTPDSCMKQPPALVRRLISCSDVVNGRSCLNPVSQSEDLQVKVANMVTLREMQEKIERLRNAVKDKHEST